MNRFPLISAAVLALLGLCMLTGCKDSSSAQASSEGLAEVVSVTEETTVSAVTETQKHSDAPAVPETTAAPAPSEPEVTVTTTEPTVVGKWALDSVVDLGKVYYKDTSVRPAVSYRMSLQLEFTKEGEVSRIHPLYGYTEHGRWYYSDAEQTRVTADFPYNIQFNPEELPSEYCFEHGNLFVRSQPDVPALNFIRVSTFPMPDEQRVEDGKAAFSVAGYWEGAWVTDAETTYTDFYDGKSVPGMKMEIKLSGDCTYYHENNPKPVSVFTLQTLGGGMIDLILKQSANPDSTIGQIEGNIYIKNNYLVWKYSEDVVIAFRAISAVDFNKAIFEEG